MKYHDLAQDIFYYMADQDYEGSQISESESLYSIEEIIESFMREQGYFASE